MQLKGPLKDSERFAKQVSVKLIYRCYYILNSKRKVYSKVFCLIKYCNIPS